MIQVSCFNLISNAVTMGGWSLEVIYTSIIATGCSVRKMVCGLNKIELCSTF